MKDLTTNPGTYENRALLFENNLFDSSLMHQKAYEALLQGQELKVAHLLPILCELDDEREREREREREKCNKIKNNDESLPR